MGVLLRVKEPVGSKVSKLGQEVRRRAGFPWHLDTGSDVVEISVPPSPRTASPAPHPLPLPISPDSGRPAQVLGAQSSAADEGCVPGTAWGDQFQCGKREPNAGSAVPCTPLLPHPRRPPSMRGPSMADIHAEAGRPQSPPPAPCPKNAIAHATVRDHGQTIFLGQQCHLWRIPQQCGSTLASQTGFPNANCHVPTGTR
jgi:hypothetical protein